MLTQGSSTWFHLICETVGLSQESAKSMTSSRSKRVFIGGLKTTTTSEQVMEYFSQYGAVEFVDLPEDKGTHRKRGFGYVAFDDFDPVDKVTS